MIPETLFEHNTDEVAKSSEVYIMQLLFIEKPQFPSAEDILTVLEKHCGNTQMVAETDKISAFALKEYMGSFENEDLPVQVLLARPEPLTEKERETFLNPLEKSQQWECDQWKDVLSKSNYNVMISDFLGTGLRYRRRCELLALWVDCCLELFPTCTGIYFSGSRKILTAHQWKFENPYPAESQGARFLYGCANIRYFSTEDRQYQLLDTHGMHSFELPDIQIGFHSLDVNAMIAYLQGILLIQFENLFPTKEKENLDGILPTQQWTCHYETSLMSPFRQVLDISPEEYTIK